MQINDTAIVTGIDIGLIRSLRALQGFRVANAEALREDVRVKIVPALERFSPKRAWGARGQITFGELSAMAIAARSHYNESPLAVEVTDQILNPLSNFLNSWLHE